ANLWSDEQKSYRRQRVRIRLQKKLKSNSYNNHAVYIWQIDGGKEFAPRSEEHTSELQSRFDLVCRLLLEKKKPTAASSSKMPLFRARTNTTEIGRTLN